MVLVVVVVTVRREDTYLLVPLVYRSLHPPGSSGAQIYAFFFLGSSAVFSRSQEKVHNRIIKRTNRYHCLQSQRKTNAVGRYQQGIRILIYP